MRRLPVYLLIDNSSSMLGEGIEAANAGLSMLISSLRQNPYALESVYLRIHSYSLESQTLLPLMPLEDVQFHNLTCSEFEESNLGKSLEELEIIIRSELNQGSIMTKKSDWAPLMIVITDGSISDSERFYNVLPKIKKINFADILILIVGYGKNLSFLKIKELSKNIVQMDTMDSNNFSAFFRWVSQNIENNSQGILEKIPFLELELEEKKRKTNFQILKENNLKINLEKKSIPVKNSPIKEEEEKKKEEKIVEELGETINSPLEIITIENIEQNIKQSNLIHNRSFSIDRIVIDFPYDDIFEFSENRAKIKFKWKYGFIDENGREIVAPIYDDCHNFSESLAAVCKNGRWGFIDIYGKEIIPPLYTKVSNFKEGLAAVNKEGKGVFLSEGKWGFIDQNGLEVIPANYNSVNDFSEGLAGVAKVEKISNATKIRYEKFGFIDKNGGEIIPLIYEDISNFSEGLAKIYIGGKYEDPNSQLLKDGRWGFIDKNGSQIIHTPYSHNDFISDFSEGIAIFKAMGKWGIIDKNGNEIIHPYYDYINKFSQGLAAMNFNAKWGFIDRKGREIIKPFYNGLSPNGFRENLAAVNLGGAKRSFLFFEGGRWGFINLKGEEVVSIKYDFVRDFNNGLALVNKGGVKNGYGFLSGGKNGFIDKNGREIINLSYDEAKSFKDNKAIAKKGDRWYLLKKIYN